MTPNVWLASCAVIALAAMVLSIACQSQQERLASTLAEIRNDRTDLPSLAYCQQNADAYHSYLREIDAITAEQDRDQQFLAQLGRDIGFQHPAYRARFAASLDHYTRGLDERKTMLMRRSGWTDTEAAYCGAYFDATNDPGLCYTPGLRAGVMARYPDDIHERDLGTYAYCRDVSLVYLSGK